MEITSATQLLQLCSEQDFDLAQAVAEYEAFRANTTCDAVRESMRTP